MAQIWAEPCGGQSGPPIEYWRNPNERRANTTLRPSNVLTRFADYRRVQEEMLNNMRYLANWRTAREAGIPEAGPHLLLGIAERLQGTGKR